MPVDFAAAIIRAEGFIKTETIPIKELNKVTTPLQLQALINAIEFDKEKEQAESIDQMNIKLTNLCRRQLIDPIISLIKSKSNQMEKKKLVKSFGNLLYPGEYPHTKNMSLEDLIAASGGFKDSAYIPEVEINSRSLNKDRYQSSSRSIKFSSTMSPEYKIEPLDEINIKEASNKFRSIEITGEVNFPGVYPILSGDSITDIVRLSLIHI